jgi:putative transposase
MKGKRFTEEQIIRVLKAVEDGGKTVEQVCREHGVSNGSFYRWKAKFGGMDIAEARRLKQLEDENRRLKKLVADQALDIDMLKEINSKNW